MEDFDQSGIFCNTKPAGFCCNLSNEVVNSKYFPAKTRRGGSFPQDCAHIRFWEMLWAFELGLVH